MDRGTWWAIVHGVTKESDTTERLKQQFHVPLAFLHHSVTSLSHYFHHYISVSCQEHVFPKSKTLSTPSIICVHHTCQGMLLIECV